MAVLLDRLREALAGRYEIQRELGRGSMAVVYLARELNTGDAVAIKLLRSALGEPIGDPAAAQRFEREIRLLAGMHHPPILPLLDSGTAGPTAYLVTPYIEGESLRERIARERTLPVDEAVRIAVDVASALDFAHGHDVVHRDIKPENILLAAPVPSVADDATAADRRHAARPRTFVADFGIARAMKRGLGEWTTSAGMIVGSPAYMSPEQAAGELIVDGRTDIYSLACVLYEMLAGRPPFVGPSAHSVLVQRITTPPGSVRAIRGAVSADIDDVLTRALARSPEDRFDSAGAFGTALTAAVRLAGLPH